MNVGKLFRGAAAKFMALVVIGLACVSLVVAGSYYGFSDLSGSIRGLVDNRIPISITLGEMRTQINGIGRDLLVASVEADQANKNRFWIVSFNGWIP